MACTSNQKWQTSYNNNLQCSNVNAEFCQTWGHISYRQESHETIRTIVGSGGYEGDYLGCAVQQCCQCKGFLPGDEGDGHHNISDVLCYDYVVPANVVKEVGNLTEVDFHYIEPGRACADFGMVGANRKQCQQVANYLNDGGDNISSSDTGIESYCIKWDRAYSNFDLIYLPLYSRFCPHGADSCLCVTPKDRELIMDKRYPNLRERNSANANIDSSDSGLRIIYPLRFTLIMISSSVVGLLLVCLLVTVWVKHNGNNKSKIPVETSRNVRTSALKQLQMLHDLKEKNMIDDQRYEEQKRYLLSLLDTAVSAGHREEEGTEEGGEIEEEKEEIQPVEIENMEVQSVETEKNEVQSFEMKKDEIQSAEEEKEEISMPSYWKLRW